MASYSARWSEIDKGFDAAYKAAIAQKPQDEIVKARQIRIKAALGGYIEFRNRALDDLVKMLGGFSSSLTEKNQADNWKNEVSKRGQEAFKMIADLDDNEESELNVFALATATREADFFGKIAAMPHGAMQGFLCECANTLYDERQKLGGKWSTTENSVTSLNERSERAGKQMLEVFEKALQEMGNENRRAAELLRKAFEIAKAMMDAPSGGGEPGPLDPPDMARKPVEQLVSTANDVAELYRDAYKSRETTLILYGNNREAVREFLDKTNLEKTLKRTDETERDAANLAGSMLTSGQQDDAREFVGEANKALRGPVENYEKGFNDFVTEFKGIFIGPIGNDVLDRLLKGNFWDQTGAGMERLNFESELKRYYDEAKNMWGIPIDGLDDVLKSAFKDEFKKELHEYNADVEAAIMTYTRAIKMLYVDYPIARLKDMLGRYKGWGE